MVFMVFMMMDNRFGRIAAEGFWRMFSKLVFCLEKAEWIGI
jgi:hypothetical protein